MTPDRPLFQFDDEPIKSSGIQILVPNSQELHQFVIQEATSSGNKTRGEIRRAIEDWLIGERAYEPNSLDWETTMDGLLFTKYEIVLSAGYSPTSGEWGDLVSFLWINDVDKSWEVAQKAELIQQILKAKGLNAHLEVDQNESYYILIPNLDETAFFHLDLGNKHLEDAIAVFGEDDAEKSGNNPFILRPGKESGGMSLDLPEFTRDLLHFQETAPHAISALYEAFNMQTPNVTLELTIVKGDLQS